MTTENSTVYRSGQPSIKPLIEDHSNNPGYKPEALIDGLITKLNVKNDAALARALYLTPPVISKIRSRRAEVTPGVMVRMHDVTGMTISELRSLMGVKSPIAQ